MINVAQELVSAADRLLKRSDEVRLLGRTNPAEARRIDGIIEAFEKRFASFLAETEEIPAQREAAKDALLKFASIRSDLKGREPAN